MNNQCNSTKPDEVEVQSWLNDGRGNASGGSATIQLTPQGNGVFEGSATISVPWGPGLGDPKDWSIGKIRSTTGYYDYPDGAPICAVITCKDRTCKCANTNGQPANVNYKAGKNEQVIEITCGCVTNAPIIPVDYWPGNSKPVYPETASAATSSPAVAATSAVVAASAVAYTATLVGVVLPSDTQPGEVASATVVTDPADYADVPGLKVVEATVPLATDSHGTVSLDGVVLQTPDGHRQPATGRVLLQTAASATELALNFLRSGEDSPLAAKTVELTRPAGAAVSTTATPATAAVSDYHASPVCGEGALQVIHGPLGGDSSVTRVLVDDKPGAIVAENRRAVYWRLPENTAPGAHRLVLQEGEKTLASFPVAVVGLRLTADRLTLVKGETTTVHAQVLGADAIPDSAWRGGLETALIDAAHLQKLAPGVRAPNEKQPGAILLRLENASSQSVDLAGAKGGVILQTLQKGSSAGAPFTYKVTAREAGGFKINANIIPMLAPIAGEAAQNAGMR
ncbi:MAG: hypothetical protein JO041_07065 [Acidobacteria bacterium]|nr:hypothetical protein [Acidobacteriota bacterium]